MGTKVYIILLHLVSEASAATVNHHAHLPNLVYTHLPGSLLVEYLVHNLHLCIVVPGP